MVAGFESLKAQVTSRKSWSQNPLQPPMSADDSDQKQTYLSTADEIIHKSRNPTPINPFIEMQGQKPSYQPPMNADKRR
jgi:hypothetical protein